VIGRPLLDPSYDAEVALDTSPDAQRRQDDVFRAMTPDQRVTMVLEMSEAAFEIAAAGIRLRHPDYLFTAAFPGALLLEP
jgi:hypothetical protein